MSHIPPEEPLWPERCRSAWTLCHVVAIVKTSNTLSAEYFLTYSRDNFVSQQKIVSTPPPIVGGFPNMRNISVPIAVVKTQEEIEYIVSLEKGTILRKCHNPYFLF